jgi:two-component system NarL family sensor kinase
MPYRNRIALFLWLLPGCFSLQAQTPENTTDSLHELLAHATNNGQRAIYLTQLGLFSELIKRDYPAAVSEYLQALALDEAEDRYGKTVTDLSQILNLYFYMGDYPDAMKIATRGLALAETRHDTAQIAKYCNTIGFIYCRQGNTAASGKYFDLYLDMSRAAKDSLLMADAYNSIGETRLAERRFWEALSPFFQAYRLYDRLRRSERLAYTSYKISEAYKQMHDYDQALVYSARTLKYVEIAGYNKYDKACYLINAGDIYKDISRLQEAVTMTSQGLAIAQTIRHREDILDAWHTLSGIYALQHRWDSAYVYYTLYSTLKDSISNENSRREIEEIHERYAADKKDREILLQKEQLARQTLWKNIFIFSALFGIVIVLLLYNRRRLKQRAAYEARLSQQQNDYFYAVIQAQDDERKRIAQDLHDTLGSILSAAKLNLSALGDQPPFTIVQHQPPFMIAQRQPSFTIAQHERYRMSLTLMDEAVTELRNIAQNLMPASLSRIGLPAAVRGLVDNISPSSGLKINYSTYGLEERLPEAMEISIYRILLELIHNAIRHSGADLLTIQLIRYPRHINIVVEDNGTGFDQEVIAAGHGKGMGMSNIRSRVGYLKGTLEIDSRPGAGTTTVIEVPVDSKHSDDAQE